MQLLHFQLRQIILLIIVCASSLTSFSQGHEVIHEPMIDVFHEYGGKTAERPGPTREPGNGGSGGNNSGGNNSANANGNSISSEKTSLIKINGETFNVTKETEGRISDFFSTYKTNGKVGGFVATIASIFSIFGLFNIDSNWPTSDAVLKMSTFNSEEVLIRLSSPNIWNRAWRAQAASFCEAEMATAIFKGKQKDAKAWLRLRDIISNPERYQNGGIKFDKPNNKLMLRSFPAEAYRKVAGFSESFSDVDINQLGMLTNYLMYFPQSRDYIIYADYIYNLKESKNNFPKLTARDKMFLNNALQVLPQSAKTYLDNAFLTNSLNQFETYNLWKTLREYLYTSKWDNGMALDSNSDELGFSLNELPNQSDLVYGNYPNSPIFNNSIPTNWDIPIAERKNVYTFYYRAY